jgi:hypothetical protein
MKYEDYIGIETPIKYKYQNLLIPELVPIIRDYLFQYPEKVKIYMDKRINVDNLIRFISKSEKLKNNYNIEPVDILNVVKEYIEKC